MIKIAPKTAAEAGKNATLGRFVADYPGMRLTSSLIQYPGQKAYTNSETCPAGTPDAGKKGVVQVMYWPNGADSKLAGTPVQGNPASLKLGQNSLVTMGFAPAGTKVPRPPSSVVIAMLQAGAQGPTATTTPGSTPTTAPVTTTRRPRPPRP